MTGLSFASLYDSRYNEMRPEICQQNRNMKICENCKMPFMGNGESSCYCREILDFIYTEQDENKRKIARLLY